MVFKMNYNVLFWDWLNCLLTDVYMTSFNVTFNSGILFSVIQRCRIFLLYNLGKVLSNYFEIHVLLSCGQGVYVDSLNRTVVFILEMNIVN